MGAANMLEVFMSRRQLAPKDLDRPEPSDARWLVMMLGALVGVIVIVGGLLWLTGLFNYSGTDAAAKILVAVLTLVGTLLGTTVTLVGLMLKRSLDARNLILKTEAEERLKLDTAIKAVELFKDASGSAAGPESAGALFALTRLGQSHFALTLLEQLWPKGIIEAPSAIWVINSSLPSIVGGTADLAASVLRANAEKLLNGRGGKWWPADYELDWLTGISFFARQEMLSARIETLVLASFDYWRRSQLNSDIVGLSMCFRKDSSPYIRQSAAAFLSILLQIYDPRTDQNLQLPTGDFSIEEVRAEIEKTFGSSFSASSEQDQELEAKLRAWVRRAPYFDAPERAASAPHPARNTGGDSTQL
jgi:hypothetical protein